MYNKIEDSTPEGYTWIICKCITRNGKKKCKDHGHYKFLVKIK